MQQQQWEEGGGGWSCRSVGQGEEGHSKAVTALRHSPCARLLASASADQTCRLYRAEDGHLLRKMDAYHTEGLNDLVWMNNCNSAFVATASDDKTIKLWDVEAGIVVNTLEGHDNFVLSLTAHPFQSFLVSGSEDETIRLWDLRCANYLVHALEAHEEPITSVSFHPTGDHVVSSSYDGLVRVWDFRTLACRRTFSLNSTSATPIPVAHTQYTPNGKYLLTSSLDNTMRLIRPFHTHIYDTDSTEGEFYTVNVHKRIKRSCPVRSIETVKTFTGHVARKYSCPAAFIDTSTICEASAVNETEKYADEKESSNMNTVLACGSEDYSIFIWNLQTQQTIHRLKGHTGPILALDYCQHHKQLATGAGGSDFTIKLWRPAESDVGSISSEKES